MSASRSLGVEADQHNAAAGNNGIHKESNTWSLGTLVPTLHKVAVHSVEEGEAALAELRRFHLEGPKKGARAVGDDLLPALLSAFRHPEAVSTGYPLLLLPSRQEDQPSAVALRDFLSSTAEQIAPGPEAARLLKDNLKRFEKAVLSTLANEHAPVDATSTLQKTSLALIKELDLGAAATEQLHADFTRLLEQVPAKSSLLGFSSQAPIYIFLHVLRPLLGERRERFRRELLELTQRLAELLEIEARKDPSARKPEAVAKALGKAGDSLVDAAALASLLGPERGASRMDPQRRKRLTEVLAKLEAALEKMADAPFVSFVLDVALVHGGALSAALAALPGVSAQCEPAPCDAAARLFDEQADATAEVYRAVRTARLELEETFVAERHGPYLQALDWHRFNEEELQLLSPVVVLASGELLASNQLTSLSQLLQSGRPVKVIASVHPGRALEVGYHFELGYFAISHREALVHQSTAARPEHLLTGFTRALSAGGSSVHLLTSELSRPGASAPLGGWMHESVAVESRAHPVFLYDPGAGPSWARRFAMSDNPRAELDWPVYPLAHKSEAGETDTLDVAVTFADFAMLDPALRQHFSQVPPNCPREELLPLEEYLQLDSEKMGQLLPFVWAIDGQETLQRLVVSRALLSSCLDRLGFWRTIEELAGVRSEHVERAITSVEERLAQQAAQERERLLEEHRQEIEEVRSKAVQEAMQQLAAALLDAQTTGFAPAPGATAGIAQAPPAAPSAPAASPQATSDLAAPEAPAAAAPAAAPAADDDGPDEAWVDTALCTSCNDCVAINAQLFVYDENKQVRIGDPQGGTFAELVLAAEKCPAHCIHPGKPLNPSEPNLADLLARAAKLN